MGKKTSRFPIGEWAQQRKEKRQVLVQGNRSIEELEGNVTELKRKARLYKKTKDHPFIWHI